MSTAVTTSSSAHHATACWFPSAASIRLSTVLASLALAGLATLLCCPKPGLAQPVIIELPHQPHAYEAVVRFEQAAFSLRNATDDAFVTLRKALERIEDAENATDAVQDALDGFYFTVTDVSLNATQSLPIPDALGEEVASLLYQARQTMLQSLQDRLALAASLVSGTEKADDAKELARLYAMHTSSRDFYLNVLLQEARDAAAP